MPEVAVGTVELFALVLRTKVPSLNLTSVPRVPLGAAETVKVFVPVIAVT